MNKLLLTANICKSGAGGKPFLGHSLVFEVLLTCSTCCLEQDFDRKTLESTGNGIYTPMDLNLLPPLYLIYADNPSDSGKARPSHLGSLLQFKPFGNPGLFEVVSEPLTLVTLSAGGI